MGIRVIIKMILCFFFLGFISLLFPTNLKYDFDFEFGKRWLHQDLNAPFDFPILKSELEIDQERSQVLADFIPYYRLKSDLLQLKQSEFEKSLRLEFFSTDIDEREKLDTLVMLKQGKAVIREIYSQKVLGNSPEQAEFSFNLIESNEVIGAYSNADFLNKNEVIQYIIDAVALTDLQKPQIMVDILTRITQTPNLVLDTIFTEKMRIELMDQISDYRGLVKVGEPIVMNNGLIDSLTYQKLLSFKSKYDQQINQGNNNFLIFLGYFLLSLALLSVFLIYIKFYAKEVFGNNRYMSIILMLMALFIYLSYSINNIYVLDLYLVPYCILPIVLLNFFKAELALIAHIFLILFVSMLLSLDFQFILLQLLIGMVVVINKVKTRYLSDFFMTLLYVGMAYIAGFISLELIRSGTFTNIYTQSGILLKEGPKWYYLGWISLNIFLTLLSFPLIPLLEKAFGITSDITLLELSDMDHPLLKKLSIEATGTLQHSLQVANLSEAAAKAISCNALLVKVAALYHDIGKIHQPEFFIENQKDINPHDAISALESAKIIIGHVTKGLELADQHKLPKEIREFIETHHGNTRVEYFYNKHNEDVSAEQVDEDLFRYPGALPNTKEQAILMLADSIEAAAKSLKEHTAKGIDHLVDRIVEFKITEGQLRQSDLTFKELRIIKNEFKRLLNSIYHVRIQYPEK